MNTLLMILLLQGFNAHNIQLAVYKIHQQKNKLVIEFSFEKEDIMTTLKDSNIELSDKTIQHYINSNFKLSLNDQTPDIVFENMEVKDKHISLVGNIPKITNVIESIKIENTCLLNIKGNSNIIEISLHGQQRDFLMNSKRTAIQVNY